MSNSKRIKALSLFSNIGVAEAYFNKIGIDVVIANEIDKRRAKIYHDIYPNVDIICGDICNNVIKKKIVVLSRVENVDVVMATPPCQGMSTAGKQKENDERNNLIIHVIDIVKKIKPKYVFIENVPLFYSTEIIIGSKKITISELLDKKLGKEYVINKNIINTQDYSVPQTRERAIALLSRKDCPVWVVPSKDKRIVTMKDAIGDLPELDPYVKDITEKELLRIFPKFYEKKQIAEKISFWHKPPHHLKRQVIAMQHTPTGCSAFDNKRYIPRKEDGSAVKGYHNTYSRQRWDLPAYTVTMDNVKISSQNNVHPGRVNIVNGKKIYSDARVLTLYEIMKIMSLPDDWNIPHTISEAFLRRIIGEGIPPLFVRKVFKNLLKILK